MGKSANDIVTKHATIYRIVYLTKVSTFLEYIFIKAIWPLAAFI